MAYLIALRADPGIFNYEGETPLLLALKNRQEVVASQLLALEVRCPSVDVCIRAFCEVSL